MKKISLLLILTLLLSFVPTVNFVVAAEPANTKLAQWSFKSNSIVSADWRRLIFADGEGTNRATDLHWQAQNGAVHAIYPVNKITYMDSVYYVDWDRSSPNTNNDTGANYFCFDVKNANDVITAMNNGFTLEFWIKPENFGINRMFSVYESNTTGASIVLQVSYESNGKVYVTRQADRGQWYKCIDNAIVMNEWNHVVVSFNKVDESMNLKYILNGVDLSEKIYSYSSDKDTAASISGIHQKAFVTTNIIGIGGFSKNANEKARVAIGDKFVIYEGQMSAEDALNQYNSSKDKFSTVYDVKIKKDGVLIPESNLKTEVEGNVCVEVTIPNDEERTENNVYIVNKDTNIKLPVTYSTSADTYVMTNKYGFMPAGSYSVVVESLNQSLDFTLVENASLRTDAKKSVDDAITNPGTDNINLYNAIFVTYSGLFQTSAEEGSEYASICNKNGIYEEFLKKAPFNSIDDITAAVKEAIEYQKGKDMSDAVGAIKGTSVLSEYKNAVLNTYKSIFGVDTTKEYADLTPEYQDKVFENLMKLDINGLSNDEIVALITVKFAEFSVNQKTDMEYADFYKGLNGIGVQDIENTLLNNIEKTKIDLNESTNKVLYDDYQNNKAVINQKLADADISTNAKLINEFYSALALEMINGLQSGDRGEAKRILSSYVTNIEGIDTGLTANIEKVTMSIAGNKYNSISDLKAAVKLAVQNAGKEDTSIGGADVKPGTSTTPGKNTLGYVINSNDPMFAKPDGTENKDDENEEEKHVENNGFTDLAGYEWAKDYINRLAELKVVNGKAEGIFAPGENVTRYEFIAMLSRAFKIENTGVELPFEDVSKEHWAYDALCSAYALGIISGVDEVTFAGDENVTREAIAAMVYRYLKAEPAQDENISFYADDEAISDWANNAVYKLQELQLMNGKENNIFDPTGFATRAETATLICRMLDLSAE